MSGRGNCQKIMLTNIYTAVLVKNNNWPSSVHCKALMVGWEAAAVTLEVVYSVMCSISFIIRKRITISCRDRVSDRLLCYKCE